MRLSARLVTGKWRPWRLRVRAEESISARGCTGRYLCVIHKHHCNGHCHCHRSSTILLIGLTALYTSCGRNICSYFDAQETDRGDESGTGTTKGQQWQLQKKIETNTSYHVHQFLKDRYIKPHARITQIFFLK